MSDLTAAQIEPSEFHLLHELIGIRCGLAQLPGLAEAKRHLDELIEKSVKSITVEEDKM